MRPIGLLAAVPAAVLLAAGCGSDTTAGNGSLATTSASASSSAAGGNSITKLSADRILAKATAALQAADSVRIKGEGGKGGERFAIDLRYSGDKSAGTLGVSGQTIELRKLGQVVYLKGSRAFWLSTGGEAAAQLLTGKWLKMPLRDKRFGLSELTDLREAAKSLLDPDGPISKGTEKTINGTPAIGLVDKSKDGGTLWVATTGEPRPLRIEPDPASDETGALNFIGYGEPFTVDPPPADLVVDVSKLPGN